LTPSLVGNHERALHDLAFTESIEIIDEAGVDPDRPLSHYALETMPAGDGL
jgi:hypothetical protein